MFGPNIQELWNTLPEERKQRIEADYLETKAEYLTLQALRQSLNLTQTEGGPRLACTCGPEWIKVNFTGLTLKRKPIRVR